MNEKSLAKLNIGLVLYTCVVAIDSNQQKTISYRTSLMEKENHGREKADNIPCGYGPIFRGC